VLVTGATGFLGRHLVAGLTGAGHEVVVAARHPHGTTGARVTIDFNTARHPDDWHDALKGIDAVVNAVGILRERGNQSFQALHIEAPQALFDACVAARITRVIQISALGADDAATTAYHLSKRAADRHLLALPLGGVVVQPSLVYGPGGASARLFGAWATLPVVPLPGAGQQQVQPIHVDDLTSAIVALLGPHRSLRGRVALVGPEPLALADFIAALRRAFGLPPPPCLCVPMPFVRLAAAVGGHLPGGLLDTPTLAMLERGNTAPSTETALLLGGAPRPVARFMSDDVAAARASATLVWTLPLLRWSIALVWIVTGILSFGVFPVEESKALLARLGLHGVVASTMLYGAAALDLLLGLATLAPVRRWWLWAAQAALMLGYTVLISVWLPEFWLHPYGPILKNLPMLAAIAMLAALEERPRWTT